ncbi:hypothetical protein [Vibrio cholerae]|uniref:hypothetical protein n=1 Tax=Vibrio cholerae TaxID=666 RepID=UPI00265A3227|nr:hypothetical protein [Vibrio cholerae]
MHKLQNGSQVSVRPQRKPLVGLGGYFSESNDQGAPSYPGQDWFNDCTDEFINALNEMGITYDQEQLDHLARAFAAVRSQEWNANVNYGIGQEVVRNGLRYIARAASGPDNGGAITPENNSGSTWDLVLPQAYSTTDMQTDWLQLAVVAGDNNGAGDFLSLEVIGGSSFEVDTRFSADVVITERAGSVRVIVTPKTLGLTNPEFYIKSTSANTYELWMKRLTDFSSPVTVVRKSRSRYSATVAGILSITNMAPSGVTLVPYSTQNVPFATISDRTASRQPNITYQNGSKARQVCINLNVAGPGTRVLTITPSGGSPILMSRDVPNAATSSLSFDVVIPPGATYSFNGSFSQWIEVE